MMVLRTAHVFRTTILTLLFLVSAVHAADSYDWKASSAAPHPSQQSYNYGYPPPSAPLVLGAPPMDALHEIELGDFIGYDPFSLNVNPPERGANVTEMDRYTKKEVLLFRFQPELYTYVKDRVYNARAANRKILLNPSKQDFIAISRQELDGQIRESDESIKITWSTFEEAAAKYQLLGDDFLVCKQRKTCAPQEFKLVTQQKLSQILSIKLDAETARRRFQLNIDALSDKRHVNFLPVEFLARVAPE